MPLLVDDGAFAPSPSPDAPIGKDVLGGGGGEDAVDGTSLLPPRSSLLCRMLQPQSAVAVGVAACAQCMMVALMSPLALAMAEDGFPQSVRTLTYEVHFACMYAPGLACGPLIALLGNWLSAALGTAILGGACAVLGSAASELHYLLGMGMCGVGWHLCFTAATLMLDVAIPAPRDAMRAQAANDFVVFMASAAASLGVRTRRRWR